MTQKNNAGATKVAAGGFIAAGILMIVAALIGDETKPALIGVGGMFIMLAGVFWASGRSKSGD